MASVIPNNIPNLRTQVVLSRKELENSTAIDAIQYAMDCILHDAICAIANKCYVRTEVDSQVVLSLDAYVFTRTELLDLMAKCREEGRKDAMCYPSAENTPHDA